MGASEIQQILESLIPIAGIVFGTLLVGYAFGKIVGLIKAWISRNNSSYDDEKIDRLAKAFIQHRKDAERRLQNIEAIITDDKSQLASSKSPNKLNKGQQHNRIEIDSDDAENERENTGSGNLKNMLNKERS